MRSGLAASNRSTSGCVSHELSGAPRMHVTCTTHGRFVSDYKSRPRQCATLLAGMLFLCQPAQASQSQQLVLLDSGNTAILGDLKRLTKTKQRFGTQEPTSVLSGRFLDAQQQLQRIELLIKIGQYDNARMQLREGSFKNLRMDLAFGQEMYRVVKPEVTHGDQSNWRLGAQEGEGPPCSRASSLACILCADMIVGVARYLVCMPVSCSLSSDWIAVSKLHSVPTCQPGHYNLRQ
eukprot:GHUV01044559.1.p1 GENE.GHUV01044559.1~~GHUV01044559.1.p1  ORF type:complete len:235 (+),score=31.06 GHUV01044559.1:213-917(+)